MNNIKEVLSQELAQLENARDVLQYSYEKCCRRSSDQQIREAE